jgi:uncharacterized protein (TIGR02246 family)
MTDSADQTVIRELLERRYTVCLNAGDTNAYAALYDDDVVWAVPNQPIARSPEEIEARLGRILSKVVQEVEVTVDDIVVEGALALASARADGTFRPRGGGDAQPLALHVLWGLRRRNGEWRIIRQIGSPGPTPRG